MNMDSGITSSHGSMDKTQKQSSEWAANQKHNQRVENTRVLMGPASRPCHLFLATFRLFQLVQ